MTSILRRASGLFYGVKQDNSYLQTTYEEGEVIFCKNNVCIHPSSEKNNTAHHPGYLTVCCQCKDLDKYETKHNNLTLILTWIPNATLQKTSECELMTENESDYYGNNNYDIERTNSISSIDSVCSGCLSHEPSVGGSVSSSSPDLTVVDNYNANNASSTIDKSHGSDSSPTKHQHYVQTNGIISDTYHTVTTPSSCFTQQQCIKTGGQKLNTKSYVNSSPSSVNSNESSQLKLDIRNNNYADRYNIAHTMENNFQEPFLIANFEKFVTTDLPSTINRETSILNYSHTNNNNTSNNNNNHNRTKDISNNNNIGGSQLLRANSDILSIYMSPEYYALRHNLNFPDSSTSSPSRLKKRSKSCTTFSIDLGEMRSLRLFFSPADNNTSGQLVIASRESQYKILHFHHGGLEKLADILNRWNLFISKPVSIVDGKLPYKHFSVYEPKLTESDLHPEEGRVDQLTNDMWLDMLNDLGQVEDEVQLRKSIFFCGIDKALRKSIWPFLLHCYSYQSTYEERCRIQEVRRLEYENVKNRRLSLRDEERDTFARNVESVVENDVVRTDRTNPFYIGDDNPNLEIMKNILLNYAVYNSAQGYTQGMSDLLAPILAEMSDEVDAFWCFVGVMKKGLFICTPTDSDMERNLYYLRELIRIMYPPFYAYLRRHSDGMDLLFCHRWLLLCFKREFPDEVAITIWETCWSNYLTDYLHLFISLAIIMIYSEDIITQDLRTDETLFHFSSLAMYMDGHVVLRKARGLLHSFHLLPKIPCTLASLCQQSRPGIWDSGHVPIVECAGMPYCQDSPCPYGAKKTHQRGYYY